MAHPLSRQAKAAEASPPAHVTAHGRKFLHAVHSGLARLSARAGDATNVAAGDALVEAVGRNSYEDCLRALGDGAYVDHLASEHSAYTGYTLRLPLRA